MSRLSKWIKYAVLLPVAASTTFLCHAQSSSDIVVKITSLSNISGNGALEVCGTAVHVKGIKPLLVTVHHADSYYTTLTAANDVWCVIYKRWTYNGSVEVQAATLNAPTELSKTSFIYQ